MDSIIFLFFIQNCDCKYQQRSCCLWPCWTLFITRELPTQNLCKQALNEIGIYLTYLFISLRYLMVTYATHFTTILSLFLYVFIHLFDSLSCTQFACILQKKFSFLVFTGPRNIYFSQSPAGGGLMNAHLQSMFSSQYLLMPIPQFFRSLIAEKISS